MVNAMGYTLPPVEVIMRLTLLPKKKKEEKGTQDAALFETRFV
jgi:hypothetical protein